MCVWRFRIGLQGELPKTAVLAALLDGCSARLLSVSADRGREMAAGEFMVDVPHYEGVGAVLSVLHEISPRVLIGLAQACEGSLAAAAPPRGGAMPGADRTRIAFA
jgi:hypothetical protein